MIWNSIRIRLALPLFVVLLVCTAPAFAQRLPTTTKLAGTMTPALTDAINQFVQGQAKGLSGENAAIQKASRQALIDQVSGSGSPAFFDAYADAVNGALLPLASDANLRVRLNAAIANGEIAKRVNSARQAKATLAFMNDKSDPVALWGLKAAKYVIPPLTLLPAQLRTAKLFPGVVDAVKAHNDSGPIIEEAYQALTLDDFKNVQPPNLKASIAEVLPDTYRLLEYRITLYANGVPASPLADNYGTLFLTRQHAWDAETAAQQQLTIKDLFGLVAALGGLLGNNNIQNRDELVNLIRPTGRAFQVVADALQDQELHKAAVEIAEITADTPIDEVAKRVSDLKNTKVVQSALAGPTSAGRSGPGPIPPAVETSGHVGH